MTPSTALRRSRYGWPPRVRPWARLAGSARVKLGSLGSWIGERREHGPIGGDGWLAADGARLKERLEALIEELAAPAYGSLSEDQFLQLTADLRPIADQLTRSDS